MPASDLRRIHAVTDNFFFWQGLRWVPMGIALMVSALSMMPGVPIPKGIRPWVGLPFIVVALWLSTSVLGRYYARHFGRVRMDLSRHKTRTSVKWFVVYPSMIAGMILDARFHPPVLVSALAFAAAVEAYRESTGGGRIHYALAAVGFVAFSLLPLFGALTNGIGAVGDVVLLTGMVYVVGGVLDHREMVRILESNRVPDVSAV
jgi:hypothetical protein